MNARFRASSVGQGMCVVTGQRNAHARTAEDMREALSVAVAGRYERVLVDLQDADYVDPLVLSAILGSQRRLEHVGGDMAVLCTSASGFADIERVGVPRHMPTFEDRRDAFEWLGTTLKELPGSARYME